MTALNKQALRSKARSASAGEWIKESGDGWEAICSSDDQANGNFIIAHFEGPDALANREFAQAANPTTVLALLDEIEKLEKASEARKQALLRAHKMFQRQRDRAVAAEKRIAEHNFENRLLANADRDIKALRQRIAELEAREVTLPEALNSYAGVKIYRPNDVIEAIRAAGIGVKGE